MGETPGIPMGEYLGTVSSKWCESCQRWTNFVGKLDKDEPRPKALDECDQCGKSFPPITTIKSIGGNA